MAERVELLQGTLDLIVLRALSTMGPQHAYGLAARLEQVAEHPLMLNQGTLYPGARPARAEGLDQGRLAAHREQPRGEILRHHQGGHARARQAGRAVAAARGSGRQAATRRDVGHR